MAFTMRAYARDMAMLADSRRQLEKGIRLGNPGMKPSDVRKLAKALAMKAYQNLKAKQNG